MLTRTPVRHTLTARALTFRREGKRETEKDRRKREEKREREPPPPIAGRPKLNCGIDDNGNAYFRCSNREKEATPRS